MSASGVLLHADCCTITRMFMDLKTQTSRSQVVVGGTVLSPDVKPKTSMLTSQESVPSHLR